jgi:hypothetical protein
VDGGLRDAEALCDLAGGKHSAATQSFIAARQFVGVANECNLFQVEGFSLPRSSSAAVENLGDLAIAMLVEKSIDLGDEFRFELAYLSDGQRPIEDERARRAAHQPDLRGDLFGLEQSYVVDKQTQNALALGGGNTRVLPDLRKTRGKIENVAACLLIENSRLFFATLLVVCRGFGMKAQFFIPFRFERIGDETIFGVDFHVASSREFRVVASVLNMLTPQRVGLSGARFQFVLNRHGDFQVHRRHQFEQQGSDGCVDDFARNPLTNFSSAANLSFLAGIDRDVVAMFLVIADTHACAA